MKKNLPYFIVIAALIFLIIGVLSSGKKTPQAMAPDEKPIELTQVSEQGPAIELTQRKQEAGLTLEQTEGVSSVEKIFNIFTDKSAPDNHYAASGWMGDFGDININEQYMQNPHSGTTSIQITYSAKETQGAGWGGIYWQNPPNNWGERRGGFDLTGYNKLVFWARGENGDEVVEKFKVGGIKGTYPDSVEIEMGPVTLGKEWQKYTINLVGQDLSYVSGGFSWVTSSRLNPNGATFYFDDIRYEYESGLEMELTLAEGMPFDVYIDRTSASNHFIASGWMGDYGDLKIDEGWTADPYSGTTCIRIVYSGVASQGARWAGIFWQHPPNNWGQARGKGYDLSAAKKLTFWARGEKGGERVEEFKMGGISGDYPDSDVAGIGPVALTPEWKQYTIDLAGKDLSHIIGGFCFATNVDVNPDGAVFYLDDIRYE
ncbi:MAG: hypothetical protein NG712_00435 [Omnitrophica bacterium]|nr:hypothetical protein [Candidatus Omnitrophota bacterium]